jgi:hypothetical protein
LALADSLQGRTTNAAEAFGSPVGCVVVFFGSKSNEFNVAREDILDLLNIDNMSLGTLDPLHIYVRHNVELMAEICG